MKSLADLYGRLKGLGIPVAYRFFPKDEPPTIPFLVYYRNGTTSLIADNHNYFMAPYVVVELYCDVRDDQLEIALEAIFEEMDVPFEKYDAYIEEEELELVGYDISLY